MRAAAALLLAGTLSAAALAADPPAPPPPTPPPPEARLGTEVRPTFEAIHLRVDPAKKEYSGAVTVDLEVRQPTDRFRFHARETLTRVAFSGPEGEIPLATEVDEHGLVTARASRPLPPGAYRLEIAFTQSFSTRAVGLFRTEKEGRSYAFTQFEAADARRAFPCWDEPGVKLPYQLTVEVPAAHLAVSNTPVVSESVAGEWKTVVFKRTPPLPAYLLALASGPLEVTPIPGLSVPGRIVTVPGGGRLAGTAIAAVPPLLAALERWFGRPFPFEKLDLIATPEFWPGAMENPGAILFGDTVLLLDPKAASARERARLTYVTAHELAHQWFGDLVTMAWWDDLWLNESFADWMAEKVTAEVYPQWQHGTTSLADIDRVMGEDARPSATPIRRPIGSPDQILENSRLLYDKGKAVLAMFELSMGPEVFRRGVRGYLAEHEWGNATAADLWRAMDRAAGRDVGAAMATFIDQPGLPLVRVEPLPDGRLALTQERFTSSGAAAAPLLWQIPVDLKYSDGKSVHRQTVLLRSAREVVTLPAASPLAWVMPDVDGAGYYRWSLPAARLGELAASAETNLELNERIKFLGNLKALLGAGLVHGDTFLAAVTPFAADPEPLVVTALLDQLDAVRPALVPAAQAAPFAGYVRRTFRPVLDRIGREPRPGESDDAAVLRSRLLLWLGETGNDGEIERQGGALARRYLTSPESLDTNLATAALELAALHGDRALFEAYRQRFEGVKTPAERNLYLRSLARFREPAVVEEALRYALAGPLQPTEMLWLMVGVGSTEPGADRLFVWTREHYDEIVKRVPPLLIPLLPQLIGGCSGERLEEGKRFFMAAGHHVPGTERQLASVADQVHDCLLLREREGASFAAALGKGDAPVRESRR